MGGTNGGKEEIIIEDSTYLPMRHLTLKPNIPCPLPFADLYLVGVEFS